MNLFDLTKREEAPSRVGTIRPTIGQRPGDKVQHFEAQCAFCPWELSFEKGTADTLSNVQEALNTHLIRKHARYVEDAAAVAPGTETWR